MRLIPRDPEHDLDTELRALIRTEQARLIDAAPVAGDWDDPEV